MDSSLGYSDRGESSGTLFVAYGRIMLLYRSKDPLPRFKEESFSVSQCCNYCSRNVRVLLLYRVTCQRLQKGL